MLLESSQWKPRRPRTCPSAGFQMIGDRKIRFRSGWEADFARYLQSLKEKYEIFDWDYEPKRFWFHKIQRGTTSYLPDFRVCRLDFTYYWVEVKGWMDAKSKTRIKRFRKYYPNEELVIVDGQWFKKKATRMN